jgi:ferredoxin
MNPAVLAEEYGFAECFAFPAQPFDFYERRLNDGALHPAALHLVSDPAGELPWANAILALIMPYRPYADGVPVSGNYPSSNAAYHAANGLIKAFGERGVRAERVYVPVRELLIRSGVGVPLRNGLTAVRPYGTRYSVQTVAANLPHVVYTPEKPPAGCPCGSCRACERACPSGAITQSGYDFTKCARAYMCGDPMPAWVMDALGSILGCEICQSACPFNAGIEPIASAPGAFSLGKLLRGDCKEALEIVGKNLKKNGRLIQHACVIAAKQGRRDLLPLIRPWTDDPREAVRVAAAYAIARLQQSAEEKANN